MTSPFTRKTLSFLRALKRHNDREWFRARKDEYEEHVRQPMIDLLAPFSRDVWALAHRGKVSRLREVLAEEPQRAQELAGNGRTLLWSLPDDEDAALETVNVLLGYGGRDSNGHRLR